VTVLALGISRGHNRAVRLEASHIADSRLDDGEVA
jgi:hypothetical protein